LSRGSKENRSSDVRELAREFRQFHGLGASFFRVAAARTGKTVTDMQVLDILQMTGPTTAGNLAELTGLTTGATTGLLNRLEEAGLVRRERDPEDGRRIIVQLVSGKEGIDGKEGMDAIREIGAVLDPLLGSWERMASGYSDEQIAFLLDFLKRSNAVTRRELARLQEAPAGEGKTYSAPLGDLGELGVLGGLQSARLVFSSGVSTLTLRTDAGMDKLYKAHFEGTLPAVKAKDGVVAIRYARRLWDWTPVGGKRKAAITLSTAVPWRILIQGAASEVTAELGGLDLAAFEVKGGMSMIHLNLPSPARSAPIRISGGASEIILRRPAGVPARVHLKGWASQFVFDDQSFSNLGNDVRMQSPGYDATAPGYDIEVLSSASMVTVTSA
jgi:DNA-binding MarR family transcriptional regulator